MNRYIGARYVIRIYENSLDPSSAEWEANINYEPITMVTYNYGSYLSKREVPANIGNPADNPTYWVQTGFYSGQIAQLEADIDAINDVIEHTQNNGLSTFQIDKNLAFQADYSDITGTTGLGMQGSCYNSTTNTYLIGFINGGGTGMLVEVQEDLKTVIRRKDFYANEIKHCNDITYNPNTNKYYISGHDLGTTDMSVVIIDATTLDFIEERQLLPVPGTVNDVLLTICYDSDNDRYYGTSKTDMFIYDNAFNLLDSIPYQQPDSVAHAYGTAVNEINQAIEYIDGKIAAIYDYSQDRARSTTVVIYNLDGTILTSYVVDVPLILLEAEGICNNKGHLTCLIGSSSIGLFATDVYLQTQPFVNTGMSPLNIGAYLSNEDLDDIVVSGTYYVRDPSGLTNSPYSLASEGFVLYVIPNGAGFLQIAIPFARKMQFAFRRCNYQGVYNQPWEYVPRQLRAGDSYTYTGPIFGFIGNTATELTLSIPIEEVDAEVTGYTLTGLAMYLNTDSGARAIATNAMNWSYVDRQSNTLRFHVFMNDNSAFGSANQAATGIITSATITLS